MKYVLAPLAALVASPALAHHVTDSGAPALDGHIEPVIAIMVVALAAGFAWKNRAVWVRK